MNDKERYELEENQGSPAHAQIHTAVELKYLNQQMVQLNEVTRKILAELKIIRKAIDIEVKEKELKKEYFEKNMKKALDPDEPGHEVDEFYPVVEDNKSKSENNGAQ